MLVALSQPAADPMPLQCTAEMVRLYLHAKLFAKIAADLFGGRFVPERLHGSQCRIAQRQLWRRALLPRAASGLCACC
jgi:hypothetical protein